MTRPPGSPITVPDGPRRPGRYRRQRPTGQATHPTATPGEARARRPGRGSGTTGRCAQTACPAEPLGVQPAQQITERRHDNETKGRGRARPPCDFEVPPDQAAPSSVRYRYNVARLTPRYLAMSFEVWPEDRRMSSPLPTRYGPRNPATPGLPRPHDLLRNVFHCKHLETCWHRSGDFLCGDCDPAIPSADAGPRGADAGTASKQQILRAVVAAGSAGGTTIVRFESDRAASQESSSHRHADERVDRCRSAVVMATVVPVSTASASSSDVPPPDKTALILGGTSIPTPNDYYVEAVRNQYIEPTHPGQNIEYVAVTTPEEVWPITGLFRLLGLGSLAVDPRRVSRTWWPQRGRTSRGGNSRGSSTSPSISRCRPGWPIWRRRWPSTATTIW